jgi:hypothetical protein
VAAEMSGKGMPLKSNWGPNDVRLRSKSSVPSPDSSTFLRTLAVPPPPGAKVRIHKHRAGREL